MSESACVLIESLSANIRFCGLSTTGMLNGRDCSPLASAMTRTMLSPAAVPIAKFLALIVSWSGLSDRNCTWTLGRTWFWIL